MAELTRSDVYQEARERVTNFRNEIEGKKKSFFQHAAVYFSISVVGLTIFLYGFNDGLCRFYNLPSSVMPLDIKRLVPFAFDAAGTVLYILYIVSSYKTDRILGKNRINLLRVFWGAAAISYFFLKYSGSNKTLEMVLAYSIPLLIEVLLFFARKPRKDEKVSNAEYQIVLEDTIETSVFSTLYFQCRVFLFLIPVILSSFLGGYTAKAELEYQTCSVQDTLYAVILDYSDTVLVQPATVQNNVLTIDTSSYTYLKKTDISLRYNKFDSVIVTKDKPSNKSESSNALWANIKEALKVPTVTDWLMVAITFVYVVATIFICIFNGKSAKATREQIEESKRQFTESKRLECMPFLQFERSLSERPVFEMELPLCQKARAERHSMVFNLRNLGNSTAINLIYSWKFKEQGISLVECFPVNAIQKGDQCSVQLEFLIDKEEKGIINPQMVFEFRDLLGNSYEQIFCFVLDMSKEEWNFAECENGDPEFQGIVKYAITETEKKDA